MHNRYLTTAKQIESLAQLNSIEFYARQIVEGFLSGIHRSPYHGFSVEFAEHRIYNPGESTRFIDWKLFGRTDKLFVKKFEAETNLRCQMVIDTSNSMLYPTDKKITKLGFSALCAASMSYLLSKQRDAAGLTTFSNKIETHLPARLSPAHQKNIFGYLENMLEQRFSAENGAKSQTTIAPTLHQIAEMLPKRSLVIFFSDIFSDEISSDIFNAFEHLRYNHHEIVVFRVTHHATEMNFDFDNRPYKIVDMETGEVIKLTPTEYKQFYRRLSEEQQRELKQRFTQYKIDFIEADIDLPFSQVLYPWLIKRSRMF